MKTNEQYTSNGYFYILLEFDSCNLSDSSHHNILLWLENEPFKNVPLQSIEIHGITPLYLTTYK